MNNREILIEKYLNGELTATESRDLLARMGEDAGPLRDELEWDTAIRGTLTHDAEALPSFSTVPNANLLAGLTTGTITKGLLSSLSGKVALYVGGALVVGAAAYFVPKLNSPTQSPVPVPATTVPIESSSTPSLAVPTEAIQTQTSISSATILRSKAKNSSKSHPVSTLKLDDSDGKNIPTKTDEQYKPPVR